MTEAFDPVATAIAVLRSAATGALGTLDPSGAPFSSFVTVATATAGAPLLLLSRLALHTRNIDADPRVSLLLVAPGGEGGDPLAGARLSLGGRLVRVARGDGARDGLIARFLARHPEAEGYAAFADFDVFRLDVAQGHLVAGFGRIHRIAADDLQVAPSVASAFEAAAADVLAHVNEDHADAVALWAHRLGGLEAGQGARLAAVDPDGMDIADGTAVVRVAFPSRQVEVAALRSVMAALTQAARNRS